MSTMLLITLAVMSSGAGRYRYDESGEISGITCSSSCDASVGAVDRKSTCTLPTVSDMHSIIGELTETVVLVGSEPPLKLIGNFLYSFLT